MKTAYFDCETSDLKGDVGRLLIASILCHDGEMVTFRSDQMTKNLANDRAICKATRDVLEEHDILVAWYGKGFDLPFVRTRLAANGERILAPRLVLDPCFHYRGWRGLGPRSSKLSTIAEFYKLDERKQSVDVSVWIDAALGGSKKAMKELATRCESDVRLLKEITDRLMKTGLVKTLQTY